MQLSGHDYLLLWDIFPSVAWHRDKVFQHMAVKEPMASAF